MSKVMINSEENKGSQVNFTDPTAEIISCYGENTSNYGCVFRNGDGLYLVTSFNLAHRTHTFIGLYLLLQEAREKAKQLLKQD